jgi:2-polyprenyl-6-hydroxyphenyl methylase/3-demethylubiquinone-9 3-methyltransferase
VKNGYMTQYYSDKLSGLRLKRCYDIAPPRIQRYLKAEVDHVLKKIRSKDIVLELGCGYGRVLSEIAPKGARVIGIDITNPNLILAKKLLKGFSNCSLLTMNAIDLTFRSHLFDLVICIQNGMSAFHVDKIKLIAESIRVTKDNGYVIFSSYSNKFWEDRLEWFQCQSKYGLIGEIDYENTKNGNISCKDGFRATTIGPEEFLELTSNFNIEPKIVEVDNSSLFCEIQV